MLLWLGILLSTAILTSALIIGDSVTYNLLKQVDYRLGKTTHAVIGQEKYMPASFAKTLAAELNTSVAPVLLLKGIAGSDQTTERISGINVIGVDSAFEKLSIGKFPTMKPDEAIVNLELATKLKLQVGDEIVIRMEKANQISLNVPFVSTENNTITLRLRISEIIDKENFGNFNIETNQKNPYSVFLSIEKLSLLSFKSVMANVMLIESAQLSPEDISKSIQHGWELAHINLKIRTANQQLELVSDEVFLPDTLLAALKNNYKTQPQPQLTYLVNSLQNKHLETPYSFVSGIETYPAFELADHEIAINTWLASDLQAKLNDTIQLKYYSLQSFRKLVEDSVSLVVKKIIPITGFAADSLLMPAFDGLKNVDRCSDWKAGIPVDFKKIRQKDEDWWKKHKGTPKAFVSYNFAKTKWGNAFGNATSVRFDQNTDSAAIASTILNGITPESVGLMAFDIRNDARWSATNAVDFTQLFLALSFFLIVAAFLLSGLLWGIVLNRRKHEQGIMLATGIAQKHIFSVFLAEGIFIAFLGSVAGVIAGIGLGNATLYVLNNAWNEIVRTDALLLHINSASLVYAFAGNLLLSAALIYFVLKSRFKAQIQLVVRNQASSENLQLLKKIYVGIVTITTSLFAALALFVSISESYQNNTLFFAGGFLLLIGLVSIFGLVLLKLKTSEFKSFTVITMAFRNLGYNFKRNMLIAAMMGIGVFIVLSTGANRIDFTKNANNNSSGTGGFALYVQTGIALHADLQTSAGKESAGLLSDSDVEYVQFLQFKNDDASCLNINKIVRPTILGVKPDLLHNRNSFNFVNHLQGVPGNWESLNIELAPNCIPAVADQTVITWGLSKSMGDSIPYTNEKGELVYLVLVGGIENSVLQGNILISERNFVRHFPSVSGSNVMIADCNPEKISELQENLENALRLYGPDIQRTTERLDTFNSVTNTYLDIFMALGAIALLIGTIGIAIVISNNIRSEKQHLAMMQAMGIKRNKILFINTLTYTILLMSSIVIGSIASFFAVYPSVSNTNAQVPITLLLAISSVFMLNGIVWIFVGTKLSVRKKFMADIRNE